MRLAIFWRDLLHYHVARIMALQTTAARLGHQVDAFALAPAAPDLPRAGYHARLGSNFRLLSDDVAQTGEDSPYSKHQLLAQLDVCNPDVVAIIGYTGQVARSALGWCRYHRRGALLLLESQAKDYPRRRLPEWLKARLVSLYDAALVSGQPHARYAISLGLSQAQIWSGYSVVDNHFWQMHAEQVRAQPTPWRERYGLPTRFFLTASRFVAKKNIAGLLNAYADYVRQSTAPAWSLVIVGDGELAPSLRRQVAALGLTQLVHFPGYLAAEEMAHYYGLASAFILASAYAEQWGLVVNEAMAAGLPVLVSDICGCAPDLVIEGVTGFTFSPREPAALTGLLRHCAEGAVDLAALGRQGQAHIQQYSVERFAENLFTAATFAAYHADRRRHLFWPPPRYWR